MFTSAAAAALVLASTAFAAPTPTSPGPTDAFTALGECTITWTADTDTVKPWKEMNIEFMTGANSPMTHMRTIATVDATTTTSFSWVCPELDLYSAVYFYQFSSPADPTNLLWDTRFLIKGTDGSSVPPPQTDSAGIKYGLGHFTDPSQYNDMPAYLKGNGQLQGAPGNGTTSNTLSSTGSGTGSLPTSTGTTSPTGSGSSGINTVTKSPSGTSSGSKPSNTSTTSTGGASTLSSSSLMAVFGALMAGVAALSM